MKNPAIATLALALERDLTLMRAYHTKLRDIALEAHDEELHEEHETARLFASEMLKELRRLWDTLDPPPWDHTDDECHMESPTRFREWVQGNT